MTDVPYPPVLHSVFSGGCNTINVTWSPPARKALGGPVTGYLAQIKRTSFKEPWDNCTGFNNSLSTSCLFTHLKPNMKYDVRVIAKNNIANGWPSAVLKASTKQAGNHINKGYIYDLFFCPKDSVIGCKKCYWSLPSVFWLINSTTDGQIKCINKLDVQNLFRLLLRFLLFFFYSFR